jgi:hypothetical protein
MPKAEVLRGGWVWGEDTQKTGDVVDAPAEQIAVWEAEGYARPLSATPRPKPEQATAPEAEVATSPVVESERDWPHKLSPEQYLSRFPEGPDADLARALAGGE